MPGAGVCGRLDISAARGFTPFVGRGEELARLQHALEAAEDGRGQIVAILGEPGVGKSRLLWEGLGRPRAAGWLARPAPRLRAGGGRFEAREPE